MRWVVFRSASIVGLELIEEREQVCVLLRVLKYGVEWLTFLAVIASRTRINSECAL